MAKKKSIDLTAFERDASEKRPIEISVKDLFLDPENPRLVETDHTKTQASIQSALEKEFDLGPIEDSLYKNSFFWEEPLVAVKERLSEFGKKDVYVVIEGNRRLAALKYIQQNPSNFPDPDKRKYLEKVPVIVRTNREETLSFVGFRHITGVLGWESAAMAQYALNIVKGGNTIEAVAQVIGDKTNKIERLIRTQSIIERANDIGLTQADAAKRFFFSYLLTATDSPSTRDWLGIKIDTTRGIVKTVNEKNLSSLWSWLYGSKEKATAPAIAESRQISKLTKIIAKKEAVKELEKTRNIDRAFSYTKPREEYVAETLSEVRSQLQEMHASVFPEGKLEGKKEMAEHFEAGQQELKKVKNLLSSIEQLFSK
jgi:hypothetical protein